jgi:hypothetical protein
MSQARDVFLKRIAAFRDAANDKVLVDLTPSPLSAGSVAAVLRNGLCVVGFAILEDFLKARVAEVFDAVGNTTFAFGQLPEGLREFATVRALNGLPARMLMEKRAGNDPMPFGQTHAGIVASTKTGNYTLSSLGFGLYSNLGVDEIGSVLRASQIDKPWEQMNALAQRIGSGVLSCEQAYKNAASRRHRAAHTPSAAVTTSDLTSYSREALAIAIGFDLLMSRALRYLQARDMNYCSKTFKFVAASIPIRFVRQQSPSKWKSLREAGAKASRTGSSFNVIHSWTEVTAKKSGDAVVVQDIAGAPISWSFPIVK